MKVVIDSIWSSNFNYFFIFCSEHVLVVDSLESMLAKFLLDNYQKMFEISQELEWCVVVSDDDFTYGIELYLYP